MAKIQLDPATRHFMSINAIIALKKRHVPLLRAKRAIEVVMEHGINYVFVPVVEDAAALKAELEAASFTAKIDMQEGRVVDTKALRERLGATQEQFAARFRIGIDVLRNWEQHVNEPNAVARNMLELIALDPDGMAARLWDGL